jgi:RHS repeat-associated protein
LRFPGQYEDQETGTYYNYMRTYLPMVGRYGESDPIGLLGGLSTYGYVSSDPLRLYDPRGLQAWINAAPFYARPSQSGLGPYGYRPDARPPGPMGQVPYVPPDWNYLGLADSQELNLVCVQWSCPTNRNPNACYPPDTPDRTTGPWVSAPGGGPNFDTECRCVSRGWTVGPFRPSFPSTRQNSPEPPRWVRTLLRLLGR